MAVRENVCVACCAAFFPVGIAVPWLNPLAPGPMPSAVPWMVSWACVALLLGGIAFMGKLLERHHYALAIANGWLLAACISAALGVFQYFGLASDVGPWVSNAAVGEAFGNLRQRNQFATLCSVGLLALLWHVAQWRPDPVTQGVSFRGRDALPWVGWGTGVVLLAGANAASSSRTGLVQWWVVAGLGVLWWWQGRASKTLNAAPGRVTAVALAALVVYLLSLLALPWVLAETTGFQSDGLWGRLRQEGGCGSRRILWSNVMHLIAQKPWLGWGWGELGFAHFETLYPGERFCDILDNAHNLPLHLAVELGVPAALLACGALIWMVWRARPWRERNASRQLAWGVLAVVGVHSLLEYPLWYGPFQVAVGLCIVLLWAMPSAQAVEGHRRPPVLPGNGRLAPVLFGFTAIVLIVFLAFAARTYWRVSQLYLPQSERADAYQDHTLEKLRGIRLFQNVVQFAELTTSEVTADRAVHLHDLAQRLLHFSPEPRVIEKLIESALALGQNEEALYYQKRYQAAFPKEHALWQERLASGDKAP